MTPLIIILLILSILLIWVYISYSNYIDTINVVQVYKKMIDDLSKAEEKEEDTFQKAFIFNEREKLINDNLATEQMRIELEQEQGVYRFKLFLSFLALGPFYNLK